MGIAVWRVRAKRYSLGMLLRENNKITWTRATCCRPTTDAGQCQAYHSSHCAASYRLFSKVTTSSVHLA